jgi:hypothetical protein
MWTAVYINHDALARIREDPYDFACRLLKEMSARNPQESTGVCIAGFKPAAIIGPSVAMPPCGVSTISEGPDGQVLR